jgi:hypothetical protein
MGRPILIDGGGVRVGLSTNVSHPMKYPLILFFAALTGLAQTQDDSAFVPLFNGKDLKGWTNVNCAPETWAVRDGVIFCTGHPTGALRTERQYENFIFEVDWRHLSSGGNSGIFIWGSPIAAPGVPFLRAVEVQVLDHGFNVPGKNEWYTTHGDVFPIHGSSMKPFGRHNGMRSFPSEERSNGSPEWNHYQISCACGVIRLSVNGKQVSGGENCNYRKGYLGLESEGAPIEFKNLRIRELPPTDAPPEMTAPLDQHWRTLFTGLDLRGWKAPKDSRWRVDGEHIVCAEGPASADGALWTASEFGDAEFVVDCQPAKAADGRDPAVIVYLRGTPLKLEGVSPGKYRRFLIAVRGREVVVTQDGKETQRTQLPKAAGQRGAFGIGMEGGAGDFMNLYVRDL